MDVDGKVLTVELLIQHVAAQAAPDELPSMEARSQRRQPDDRPLGSGIDVDAAQLLLPAVTFVCSAVATALVEGAVEPVRGRLTKGIDRLLRRVRRRKAAKTIRVNRDWTGDDLARIRSVAMTKAVAFGLQRAEAQLIADAIVGVLASERDQ